MRDDQYTKLQGLSEKLTDSVILEADPEKWPGGDREVKDLTREERGDRYWCKKNAAATLTVLMKITSLIGVIERKAPGGDVPPNPDGDGEVDLDKEIREAEKAASNILRFDKRARG